MTTIQRSIRIVTPAFVAGARPRGTKDEIEREAVRATGIAAGLRWWFRALAGGILGSFNIDAIHHAEAALFGAAARADGKQGPSRLRFTIRQEGIEAKPFEDTSHPLAYLAYGMAAYPPKVPAPRCYLVSGKGQIDIAISVAPLSTDPEIASRLVAALLTLWVRFSGLGARTRHGAGCVEFAEDPQIAAPALEDAIRELLQHARTLTRGYLLAVGIKPRLAAPEALPVFPVAAPGLLSIDTHGETLFTPREALEEIKQRWRKPRLSSQPNRTLNFRDFYKPFLRGKTVDGEKYVHLAGLGLPIPFRIGEAHGQILPAAEKVSRRASPIWFCLFPVTNDSGEKRYAIVTLYWHCVYLPDPRIMLKSETRAEILPLPPDQAEHLFTDELGKKLLDWTKKAGAEK